MATARKMSATAKKTSTAQAPTHTARGRAQDRALVSAHQDYEVSYVARVTGSTAAAVKKAIQAQGHTRVKVVKALRSGKA